MKHIDEIYKDWSGVHHTVNSCYPVHDSAEACDFAEYYYKIRMEANAVKASDERVVCKCGSNNMFVDEGKLYCSNCRCLADIPLQTGNCVGENVNASNESESKPQICYKTNEPCKYNCKGLCKESC